MPDQHLHFGMTFAKSAPARASLPVNTQRPARARKPAQRDGIVSWSEAIATIASVDPVGNAALLDDVRRTGYSLGYELPVPSMFPNRRHSLDESTPRRRVDHQQRYAARAEPRLDLQSGADDGLTFADSAYSTMGSPVESAPCPHADCKPYITTQYRLERGHDEELSPMCSHLLYEHHITPFACGEVNCERKGARGYFLQKDLVRHVRDAHPYAAALHRLRGRVDSALLDQSRYPDLPRQSIEVDRIQFKSRQPRESDFMALRRINSSPGLTSGRKSPSNYVEGSHRTPRSGVNAVFVSPASMHVHPSSTKTNNKSSFNCRQASSDSDLQILSGDPFEASESSKTEIARSVGGTAYLNGRNKLSSARNLPEGMNDIFALPTEPHPTSRLPLSTTIPNSQSSESNMSYNTSLSQPQNGQAPTSARVKPTWHVEPSIVDRSYEFSDEEDGIQPATTRASPPQPPSNNESKLVPQSFIPPRTKVESPQIPLLSESAATSVKKGYSTEIWPLTTPSTKHKSRNSAIHNVLDSEEFDELSFGENGFILLSTRPRSGRLSKVDIPTQVKDEEAKSPALPAEPSREKLFRSIENYEDVDELAQDDTSVSSPHRAGAVPSAKLTRYIFKPKSGKKHKDGAKSQHRPSTPSHQTPRIQQRLPVGTSTPLLDLVNRGFAKDDEILRSSSSKEIPSTSELGSSPNARPAQREPIWPNSRFAAAVTPHKSWASRTVKLEDEGDIIVTPEGTLRKCGQDGFVCRRAFCFGCRSDDEMIE